MRGYRRAAVALLAAAAVGRSATAWAQEAAALDPQAAVTRAAAMTTAFERWAGQHSIADGAIAVLYDGRLVGSAGFGAREPDEPGPVASLSKAITALCVSRLIDAGRLGYETTVGEALAPFLARAGPPADARVSTITVGDMLRHRSGIVRTAPLVRTADDLSQEMRSPLEEQVRRALAEPLRSPPGERYEYSNQAYIILSLIVEAVTGEDYAAHCARSVLGPIGIRSAYIDVGVPQQARSGAGGWAVSAVDYARFVELLDPQSPQIGPATRAWLAERAVEDPAYGLGFSMVARGGGRHLIRHTGLIDDTDVSASALFVKWPAGWTVALNLTPARPDALEALGSELNQIVTGVGPNAPRRSR